LLLTGVGIAADHQSRPSETLLPNTTQGFFAISNVDTLKEHWNKTQLGHLMADPIMEPFTKDIRRQFEDRWSSIHERLGVTLDDLKGVPGGDVGIGLIAPKPGMAALAIVIDVNGKLPQANEMLKKVTATQLQRGAKRSEWKMKGCPDVVVQFDLPELEEEKEASLSTLQGSEKSVKSEKSEDGVKGEEAAKGEDGSKSEKWKDANGASKTETDKTNSEKNTPRQAFYCLTGTLLVVTDNREVMQGILGRAMGPQKNSLADCKPFQVVVKRCRKDYGEGTPQIRWFIHPLGYAEAARAATPEDRRRKGKSILEVMRNQGVGAIQGVGGFFDFKSEGYEFVHRTAVYAPGPYEKAMKMLVLPNQAQKAFEPQPWVPRDIATYSTLYFDIANAFKNFGSLFDELFGQGETGWWDEVKQGLRDDPNGPMIDLEKELIRHLGQRVSMLTDYQLPITTTSERLLFTIETKDPKAVAVALEKMIKNDPTAKRREINGQVIWEFVEDQSPTPEAPEISFGDMPAVTPVRPMKKRKKQMEFEEEDEEVQRLLPHAAMTVWQGNLMVASHIDFLMKVIAPPKKPELLAADVDYKRIDEQIKKFDPEMKCVRVFSRTDEEYRPTYELVRQNKMPQSEGLLAKLLNALFGEGKRGQVRAQKIDGRELPEYQVVRRYLGPAGLQATSEPDGWYLKGFTLSKKAE
jgi:hypothetical protein